MDVARVTARTCAAKIHRPAYRMGPPRLLNGDRVRVHDRDWGDVYPKLMDMSGLEHPQGLDGRSLVPELTGQAGGRPDWVLCEFHDTTCPTGAFMLRRGDWKYVAYVGYEPQLFDLKGDPEEVRDLAKDSSDVVKEMDSLLRKIVDIEAVRSTRALFLAALGHLAIELCASYLPMLYPLLIESLGLSLARVGVIAMVAGIGQSLAQPIFGYLSDRWGPYWIGALSVAWIGLFMGLAGVAGSYPLLTLMVGLGTLGSAAFHPAGATIVSASSKKRRGAAVSVFSVGGSIGAALSPLWVAVGVERWGTPGTLVLIPVAFLVSALLRWQLGRGMSSEKAHSQGRRSPMKRRTAISLALIVMAVMCLAWFKVAFTTYLPIWLQSQGRSLAITGRVFSVHLLFMGLGSLVSGPLSDRLGRWQLYVLSLVLLGPAGWLFLGASAPMQVVLSGVIGALVGATFPVSIAIAQEAWPSAVGIASGLVMGLGWFPGGIGASFTGLVADRWSLEAGLRMLVLPTVLGAACILAYAAVQRAGREATDTGQTSSDLMEGEKEATI